MSTKSENYTERVTLRFTKTEYKKLERMAKPFGSMSKFIRTHLLSDKKTIIEPKAFLKGTSELSISINRAGNNINQIARLLNTTKDMNNPVLMKEWFILFEEYSSISKRVEKYFDDIFREKIIP
jgi:hypothetical protein